MTEVQLAALARYKTFTDSNSFPNSELQPLLNAFKDEISSLITKYNSKLFVVPATDTFNADQREYKWPDDVLNNLITVEFAFGQATPIPYVLLNRIARKDFKYSLTEANITGQFSNTTPHFFVRRRAVYLLSGAIDSATLGGVTVASGIRVTYRAYPADLSSALTGSTDIALDPSSTTFGFPKQFHELLARRVGIEYKSRNKIALSETDLKYDVDLLAQLKMISNDDAQGEEQVSHLPYDDGSNY